ncbi:HNH endonuclease [uncultured Tenacibaculum sp.]|uniref:HNH endonuclease n=1 Tax=uncultured Tenacibaculum sp. TaxID=174713 RepID=UPI00260F2BEF|nr:HNH endonuclease [uncultured Tenacibaculum sp.]
MHSHIYGKKHFEHKTSFEDMLVFSDITQNSINESKPISNVLFVEIEKSFKNPDKWYIHFERTLSSEYGDFFLIQGLDPTGKTNQIEYDVTQETTEIINKHILNFQNGEVPYYTINGKEYIRLDQNFTNEDAFIGNNTSKPNHNIEYEAFVTLFISEDGARLEHAYQNIKSVNDHEILIFIERNSGTNLFGTVFRLKKGRNVKTLPETDRVRAAQIARAYGVSIIANELSTMIREELKNENSWFYLLLFKNLQEGSKIIRWGTNTALTGLSTGLKDISKLINEAKLGSTYWNTQSKDGKGNPNFSPLLPKLPEDGILDTKGLTSKIYTTYIAPLGERLVSFEKQIQKHSFVKKLVRFDATKFVNVLKGIPEILDTFFEAINDKLHEFYYFINGLLAGLINSIVEFFKAIFDILALLLDIINGVIQSTKFFENPTSYLSMFVESFENFIDVITNTFTVENLKKVVSFLAELPKLSFALIKGLFNKVSNVEIDPGALGYYLGFSIGFIASEVATFFLTGGSGNIAKGIKTVFQSYKSLANTTGKAIRKTVTFSFDTFIKVVKKLLDFSKNIPKYVDEFKKIILEFINKLNSVVNQIFNGLDAALDLLYDLGVVISQKLDPNTGKVLVQDADGAIYMVKHNGKTIMEGTEDAVRKFAQRIDEIRTSGGNAKKKVQHYLDELAENLNVKHKEILEKRKLKILKGSAKKYLDVVDSEGDIVFRGSQDEIQQFLKVLSKNNDELTKVIKEIIKNSNKFDEYKDALNSRNIFVSKSKRGLVPDYLSVPEYLYKGDIKYGKVKIKLTGVDAQDFKAANKKVSLKKKPSGYVWHHMDDYDPITGECTMQLVNKKLHEWSCPHKGGAGLWMDLFRIVYKRRKKTFK